MEGSITGRQKESSTPTSNYFEIRYHSISPLMDRKGRKENLINAGVIILFIIGLLLVLPLFIIMIMNVKDVILLSIYFLFMIPIMVLYYTGYYPFWNGYIYIDDEIIKFRRWGFFTPIYSHTLELYIRTNMEIIYFIKQDGMSFYKDNKKIGFLHLFGLKKTDLDQLITHIKKNKNINFIISEK